MIAKKKNTEKSSFKRMFLKIGLQNMLMGQTGLLSHLHKQNCIGTRSYLFVHVWSSRFMAAFATEINSCNKGHLTHKLKNIFYLAFYRKKELLTPAKHPYCSPAPKTAEYAVYNHVLYTGKKIFFPSGMVFLCFRTKDLDTG